MARLMDMTNKVFGELTVIHRVASPSGSGVYWLCRCSCGNDIKVDGGNLRRGYAQSCGCKSFIDLGGKRFGRLVVTDKVERPSGLKHRGTWWACRCDCGDVVNVSGESLRGGLTKSCGCLQRETTIENFTTHGLSKTPEYKIWNSMIQRCRTDGGGHERYGERGIRVCERWVRSFANFYQDMGPRPTDKHTLDRRDNDGNYEPGNCRWVTQTVQLINRGLSTRNKTGVRGVSVTASGKFLACLGVNGESKLKREFVTFEEAVSARQDAENEFHRPLLEK